MVERQPVPRSASDLPTRGASQYAILWPPLETTSQVDGTDSNKVTDRDHSHGRSDFYCGEVTEK